MSKRILLIEDNLSKANAIRNRFADNQLLHVEWVTTLRAAFNLLNGTSKWDCVVTDMAFESSEGISRAVRKDPSSGINVFQFIEGIELDTSVIIVTQHAKIPIKEGDEFFDISLEELDGLMSDAFPELYHGLVYSKVGFTSWLDTLEQKILRALND